MDTTQIFKKAWGLVWRYRALWLFGFLLALTVNSALWLGFPINDRGVVTENRIIVSTKYNFVIRFPGQGLTLDFRNPSAPVINVEGLRPDWYRDLSDEARISDVWALLISLGVVVAGSILMSVLFRVTSQAALIRMVDENERSEKMASVGRGLRLGWSRVAWKLFLIDLCITLAAILVFSLLFILAVSPFFLFGLKGVSESVVSVIGILLLAVAGLSLFTVLAIAVAVLLSITRPVMVQACAIDGLGVWASIGQGFRLLKTRFSRVIVTWLVSLGVRLIWTLGSLLALIFLSPVILLTMLAGVLVGGLLTVLTAGIASLFVSPIFAWIIGAVFGLPLFIIVTFSPITFLSGLVEVFKSSFWTLSYREFRPQTSNAVQPVEKTEAVMLSAALAQ
jgi:hypothetical protein